MQFILTEEELNNLAPLDTVKVRDEALLEARTLILTAAEYTCIHDADRVRRGYCDDCPIEGVNNRRSSRLICTLPRNYSK